MEKKLKLSTVYKFPKALQGKQMTQSHFFWMSKSEFQFSKKNMMKNRGFL